MSIADKLTLLVDTKEALRIKLGLPENLPFSEYYKYASTHPDTAILSLFTGGKQGVWYDPSDITTLYQDAAGTVPVTKDGDPVALMRDKSGNNNHATQSVSTSRPVYKADGVLHWLETDGVDDSFNLPATPMPNPDRISIHAILSTATVVTSVWSAYQSRSGYPDYDTIRNGAFESVTRDISDTYTANTTGVIVKDKVSVISSEIQGSLCRARVGLSDYVTKNISPHSDVAWGGAKLFRGSHKGKYFGSVMVFGTPENQDKIVSYLAKKAGVTL